MAEHETRPHNLYTIYRYPPVAQRQSTCLKSRASQARNLPGGPVMQRSLCRYKRLSLKQECDGSTPSAAANGPVVYAGQDMCLSNTRSRIITGQGHQPS